MGTNPIGGVPVDCAYVWQFDNELSSGIIVADGQSMNDYNEIAGLEFRVSSNSPSATQSMFHDPRDPPNPSNIAVLQSAQAQAAAFGINNARHIVG